MPDPLEIIGAARHQPHDAPHDAGLAFSMWPGDTVKAVTPAGCIIAYGNVRHIWRRLSLTAELIPAWEIGDNRNGRH